MRQIFLDTETTGLYHTQGHRIIEVAAVEVVNRRLTQTTFSLITSIQTVKSTKARKKCTASTLEFLQDKPRFADIAQDLIAFIADAELIMHNAPFDVGFLNYGVRLNWVKNQLKRLYC